MHCYICDSDSDTIQFEHGEYGPCSDCQSAIFECLLGYPDSAPVPEDEEVVDDSFDVADINSYFPKGSHYSEHPA